MDDPRIIVLLIMFGVILSGTGYLYLGLMNKLPWQKKNKS